LIRPSSPGEHSEAAHATSYLWAALAFVAGLIWSLGTAFGANPTGLPSLLMVSCVCLAVFFLALCASGQLWRALRSFAFALMYCHLIFVTISYMFALRASFGSYARYVLLALAWLVLVAVSMSPRVLCAALIAGLITGTAVFAAYSFGRRGMLSPGNMARVIIISGGNHLGYLAAGGVVVISGVLVSWRRRGLMLILVPAWAAFAFTLIASKSRTAIFACVAGLCAPLFLRFPKIGLLAVASFVTVLGFGELNPRGLASQLDTILNRPADYTRDTLLSNRERIWRSVITEAWLPNFWLGIGPGGQERVAAIGGAHNGILRSLGECGSLGTLPVLAICVWSLSRCAKRRKERVALFFSGILAFGLAESLTEQFLFSYGTSSGVLLLLSMAAMIAGRPAAPSRSSARLTVPRTDENRFVRRPETSVWRKSRVWAE